MVSWHVHLMNDQTKTLLTVTLLGASLLLALAFQIRLTGPAGAHFAILAIGAFLYGLILLGFWIEEKWAEQLSLVFFALGLVDLIWMYVRTHDALIGSIALLINVAGITIVTYNGGRSLYSIETYDIEEDIRDLKAELESLRNNASNARKKNKRK